jgi:hypothetical protein
LKTESLGVYIDGERGLVRPSWKRLSKIVSACDFMSRRPRVTSKQLERLIGHITYIALLFRPLLSILNSSYGFVQRDYQHPIGLWPSVAREMWLVRCLLPLARCRLSLPVQPTVFACDASLSGMSVCSTVWDANAVSAIARWNERFRFKHCEQGGLGARAQALSESNVLVKKAIVEGAFVESTRDADAFIPVADFPDVPPSLLDTEWHQLFQSRWGKGGSDSYFGGTRMYEHAQTFGQKFEVQRYRSHHSQ